MSGVPELNPRDVGTEVPVSPEVAREAYTWNFWLCSRLEVERRRLPVMFQVPMRDQLQTNVFKATVELAKYILAGRALFSHPLELRSTFVPTRLLNKHSALVVADPSDLDASVPNRPNIEFMHIPSNVSDVDLPDKGIFSFNTVLICPESSGTMQTCNPRIPPPPRDR
ncbi:hypothetical protein GSI_12170 [Ganoderma sinense ZZ0214-1]|uniref:Uncharacterized protein n=1 Tax=Ganoderma sinense ZZ0214-1 TaxID=1077348 RepID=A0A2G8RY19_9APHY|nr:hypothetical protein GSI_12170 [Ganoderma sinense ZZ0214-1]